MHSFPDFSSFHSFNRRPVISVRAHFQRSRGLVRRFDPVQDIRAQDLGATRQEYRGQHPKKWQCHGLTFPHPLNTDPLLAANLAISQRIPPSSL